MVYDFRNGFMADHFTIQIVEKALPQEVNLKAIVLQYYLAPWLGTLWAPAALCMHKNPIANVVQGETGGGQP